MRYEIYFVFCLILPSLNRHSHESPLQIFEFSTSHVSALCCFFPVMRDFVLSCILCFVCCCDAQDRVHLSSIIFTNCIELKCTLLLNHMNDAELNIRIIQKKITHPKQPKCF